MPAATRWAGPPLPLGEAALFEQPRESRRRIVEWSAVVLGFSVLVAAFTWPQFRDMESVPDLGDPLFSIWRLSWIDHQLAQNPSALFDANIFYPERLTLTYSDPILVAWLLSAPLFRLGLPPVVIYNIVFLGAFVLSGVSMYLLVRALTGRREAAVVAGVVFTLYPYRFEHYSHLELQMTMWMPVVLWSLHRTLARARIRDGLVAGVAFALQTLSSLYYGALFAAYLMIVGAALWIGRRLPLRPVPILTAAALLAALLTMPVASKYAASRPTIGERDVTTVSYFSARGRDYLKPNSRMRLYEPWAANGIQERQLFPGVMPAALALIGAWPPLSVATIAYTAGFALTFECSLGVNGFVFPWLRDHAAAYRSLRAPSRFSMLGGMTLAILSGYGVARLLARWPRARTAILAATLAPTMIEALPRIQLQRVWREPPAVYASLAGQHGRVLAEFPTPDQTGNVGLDTAYMYFSTFHWQKLLNGHSGFFPASYIEFARRTLDFPSDAALQYLRERGVEYIGWHGAFTDRDLDARTATRLDARPDLELVAIAPWQGGQSRLYRFKPTR